MSVARRGFCRLTDRFPRFSGNYVEPLVGAGSVFFRVA